MTGTHRYEHKLNALITTIRAATARYQHGMASEEDMAQQRKDKNMMKFSMLTGYYLQLMQAQDEEQVLREAQEI